MSTQDRRPPTGSASAAIAASLTEDWFATRYEIVDLGFETPCWRWRLFIAPNGYGRITRRVNGARYTSGAHRVLYECRFGPLGPERVLDHRCRNRSCVNPGHVEPVSDPVNVARRPSRLRGRRLTAAEVQAIRQDPRSSRAVAAEYGVSQRTVVKRRYFGYAEVAA